jgi:hypothetical protein
MQPITKVVVGITGLVAVWLILATTLFSGTGSVEPRPGQRPAIFNTVPAPESGVADPSIDPRP